MISLLPGGVGVAEPAEPDLPLCIANKSLYNSSRLASWERALRAGPTDSGMELELAQGPSAEHDRRLRQESLQEALAGIGRRFGPGVVRRGGDGQRGGLRTGADSLDALFIPSGIPRRRLSWLAGAPGAGGLSLGLALLAGWSRELPVALVDFEKRVDPGEFADYGGRLENCWWVRPGQSEPGWAAARALVLAGVDLCLLVADRWSPVGGAVPALLQAALEERDAVALLVGGKEVPAAVGGRLGAQIACHRERWTLAHGDVAGIRVRLEVVRSRIGAPGASCLLEIRFPRPYPNQPGIVDLGRLEAGCDQLEELMVVNS